MLTLPGSTSLLSSIVWTISLSRAWAAIIKHIFSVCEVVSEWIGGDSNLILAASVSSEPESVTKLQFNIMEHTVHDLKHTKTILECKLQNKNLVMYGFRSHILPLQDENRLYWSSVHKSKFYCYTAVRTLSLVTVENSIEISLTWCYRLGTGLVGVGTGEGGRPQILVIKLPQCPASEIFGLHPTAPLKSPEASTMTLQVITPS